MYKSLTVLALYLIAIGCKPQSSPPPLPVSKIEAEEDIREAVFREYIVPNKFPIYFLWIENGKDPNESLVNRFKNIGPVVKKGSELNSKNAIGQSMRLTIKKITWINATEVEVIGSAWVGPESAIGIDYVLE